ncbi:hypothetical protein M409DRAFT_16524 [Zasmidium cellare ATCC 36951]|uniref:MHD domain-containing protein n=1 Tax=Zasmidium cellare ATCC 36951 TaxID=1080233 RepID=A0A6A6D7H3_ZASCE|nr:uncharacterized protein M409DRAFT_16524 [Zasmidium cellare ATCC 36951]KAF2174260.1 hypothetical protein M409DRAFT_16524 [Zasmidium cellare ATCC 36951]
MERTEYPGMLPKLQPGQAVDILADRVRSVGRLNTSIADWLQERSRLEEQYAAGLRRLARRPIDDNDLGIFTVPWNAITNSMDILADSHSSLASKLEVDVEAPLRAFQSNNREMQAMATIQGNLASLAKDVERAQQKTDKLQTKNERADPGKVANASSDLDNARQQWESQAPYVFENLQALDETRVNQLRDLLTQFQTLEVDQVEKARVAAEQCLNVLLNVETHDEIKTFAIRTLSKPRPTETPRSNRMSVVPGMGGGSASRTGTSSSNALAPIASNDDQTSQFSGNTPESSKKGGLKGLKRLGTVMSRRNSKQPSTLPSTSESPERKSRLPGPFGRLGRNKDSYSLEPPQEERSSRRPSSPLRMGSEVLEPPGSRQEPASPASTRPPQLDPIPQLNGSRSPTGVAFPNGSHQGDLADLEPPRPVQQDPPTIPVAAEPQRDNESFSVPPPTLDPISQAQADAAFAERTEPQYNVNIRSAPIQEEGSEAALANMAGRLQAPPPVSRRVGTVRGRRDNRNSAVISTYGPPDQASQEPLTIATPPTAETAFEPAPVSTQVPAPAVQPPVDASASQSPSGAFTSPASSTPFSPFSLGEPQSPLRSRAALGTDITGDNQSIRSGRSLQSTASHTNKHPELQAPGLSSSIVETVSARFEQGKTVSSQIIGEIALAYNAADFNSPFGHENIRLEHFSTLEKVAPNPAFINQSPEQEGEYTVNLANLSRTQVAFKYQLRGEQSPNTHLPLLLTPAYKIEPTQASVIISYSLRPDFVIPNGQDSVTFHNVMIALTLEGARASGCQSKPVGTFAREKNLVYWQLGDVTLSTGAAPEKLLARFATDGEAKGGSIEARWEISGEHAAGLGSALSVSQSAAGEGADPFADEEGAGAGGANTNWKMVPLVKKIASGSYVAKS